MKYKDDMFEGYLDPEEKFYDYKTSSISGSEIFDTTKTGVSFYDQFLNKRDAEYLKKEHNLTGKIVYMSPEEYYKECADHAWRNKTSVNNLKASRSRDTGALNHLKQVLTVYKRRFPLPYINYAEGGQEGLHRMYIAGELFGWDAPKHPVLVINWADPDRRTREVDEKRRYEIESAISKSVEKSCKYNYTSIDEFKEQLEWELDREFQYIDTVAKPVQYTFDSSYDEYIVKVSDVEYAFSKEDIKLVDKDEDDLDDLDLGDEDELEDFLRRYGLT